MAQENQIQLTGLIAIKPLLESGLCSLGLERNYISLQQDKQQVMPEAFYFQEEKLVVFLQASSSSLIRIWPRQSQFPSSLLLPQPCSWHMGELSFLQTPVIGSEQTISK